MWLHFRMYTNQLEGITHASILYGKKQPLNALLQSRLIVFFSHYGIWVDSQQDRLSEMYCVWHPERYSHSQTKLQMPFLPSLDVLTCNASITGKNDIKLNYFFAVS